LRLCSYAESNDVTRVRVPIWIGKDEFDAVLLNIERSLLSTAPITQANKAKWRNEKQNWVTGA